jgi:hypothetical protein
MLLQLGGSRTMVVSQKSISSNPIPGDADLLKFMMCSGALPIHQLSSNFVRPVGGDGTSRNNSASRAVFAYQSCHLSSTCDSKAVRRVWGAGASVSNCDTRRLNMTLILHIKAYRTVCKLVLFAKLEAQRRDIAPLRCLICASAI